MVCYAEKGNQWQSDQAKHAKYKAASTEQDWGKGGKSAHNQVKSLTVKKSVHLILHSGTRALQVVTVAITAAPDGGFHRESICTQPKLITFLITCLRTRSSSLQVRFNPQPGR